MKTVRKHQTLIQEILRMPSWDHKHGGKLTTNWDGSYRVTNSLQNRVYELEELTNKIIVNPNCCRGMMYCFFLSLVFIPKESLS